jgi:phosphate transport system substrate-binding protein
MKTSDLWSVALVVLLALGVASAGCGRKGPGETATSGNLTVCVCESHVELFQEIAGTFHDLYKEASVSVVGATTRGAIVGLINDSVKVIVTDRPLNAEEWGVVKKEKIDLQEIAVARDAFAVVVNRLNETTTFSRESLRGILAGTTADWSQVPGSGLSGPVELALTDRNSGAYELLRDSLFSLAGDLAVAAVLPSQREVVQHVARRPQAIGLVSVACYRSPSLAGVTSDSSGTVKALAFAGVDSTGQQVVHRLHQANIHLGRYPLSYSVYVYFRKESDLAAGFTAFVAGAEGQKMILDWGLVPVTMPVRIVTLT